MIFLLFFVSFKLNVRKDRFILQPLRQLFSKRIINKYIPSIFNKHKFIADEKLKHRMHDEKNNNSKNQLLKYLFESPIPQNPSEPVQPDITPAPASISSTVVPESPLPSTSSSTIVTPSSTESSSLTIPPLASTPLPISTPTQTPTPLPISTTLQTPTPLPASTTIPTSTPLPASTTLPTSSPTPSPTLTISKTQNQIDEDEDEERKQRYFLITLCATFFFILIVLLTMYLYCRRREEEQNPEYTRAILGDDAFEFSQLQIL